MLPPKSFRRVGADPHDVVIPGAFRESFYKGTVIKSVTPIKNRYRKIKLPQTHF